MARHSPGRRAGFTLVELLVAMAVIVTLAAIAVAIVPQAMDQDRTTDAASTITQHLMIAKARATRENSGHGIRFILAPDPTKGSPFWATEMQYIESAPTTVPNPLGLTRPTDPYVEFDLTAPASPVCRMVNVAATDEAYLVIDNDLRAKWYPKLYCPVMGADEFGRTQRFEITGITAAATPNTWVLALSTYPTALIGAGTTERVYRFAIEPRSRSLLGEPSIPLPKNVCVDFTPFVSIPAPQMLGADPLDFELIFAPNGTVIAPVSSGTIFLWVRDYTKLPGGIAPLTPNGPNPTLPYTYAPGPVQFQTGGEQQLITIKAKTGAVGVYPVLWPQADGTYPAGQNPHHLARTAQ